MDLTVVRDRIDDAAGKVGRDRATMDAHGEYYRGIQPKPWPDDRDLADDFRMILERSRSNFMRIVVDAAEDRLHPDGFRLSGTASPEADARMWEIWQASKMDREVRDMFTTSMVAGRSFLSVSAGDDLPRMGVEDPRRTWVEHSTDSSRERLWAVRRWEKDDITYWRYWDAVETAVVTFSEGELTYVEQPSEHGAGVVPVVPVLNRPGLWTPDGESEISDVTSTQDRIDETLFYRQLAVYYSAHPQKWATGLDLSDYHREVAEAKEAGEEPPPFPIDIGVDRLVFSQNPDTQFGNFQPGAVTPYIDVIEQDVLHIAVQTRTPRHYLIQQGQSPSGDAIKSAETGLVARVREKQEIIGESLEEAMRIARRLDTGEDSPEDSEVIWGDPEYRSEGELVDGLVKMGSLGIPKEILWERWGMSPSEITRAQSLIAAQALLSPEEGGDGDGIGLVDRVNMLGTLIRSGVDRESAELASGLQGLSWDPDVRNASLVDND